MERTDRKRLDMAVRVKGFCHVHPSAEGGYTLVLGKLDERVDRMKALAEQQEDGYLTKHSAVTRRRDVRRRIHDELLRHLVTVAAVADGEQPGVAEQYRFPRGNENNEIFGALARTMLEQGNTQRELLLKHGLSERLLDDLDAAVKEFDASILDRNEGLRGHVGARAELRAVSNEIMLLVDMLDGLNRYRFAGNAELLAAWESARRVVTGPRTPDEAAVEAPKPAGDVRPAA
jgi:hypothetical protein